MSIENTKNHEFLLCERLLTIKQTIEEFGEDTFYIAFSGGKDSTVLHYLIDEALPDNRIPRVFVNTGIEYKAIVDFVKDLASKDDRIIIKTPTVNIKTMLEKEGYPFKSKEHSLKVGVYKRGSRAKTVLRYRDGFGFSSRFSCPKCLLYQYEDSFTLKISDKCCYRLKKDQMKEFEREREREQ